MLRTHLIRNPQEVAAGNGRDVVAAPVVRNPNDFPEGLVRLRLARAYWCEKSSLSLRGSNDDQPRAATVSLKGLLGRRPSVARRRCFLRPFTTCVSLTVAARIREPVETGRALRRAAK